MKVYVGGSRFHAGQTQRIDEGLAALGHVVTPHPHDADCVFVNNPWFDQVIADKAAGQLRGKIIFNVQDIPHHCPDYDLAKLKSQLGEADAVTSISKTTAADLRATLDIDSHVIYQPIMPVTRGSDIKYPYKAMAIGRIGDANKRTILAVEALIMLGLRGNQIVTVGMESPWYGGVYWGVAAEPTLNDLYGSVHYVICTGRYEGIGLPMIEAMAAGAIPLVCSDLYTREEFLPSTSFPEYLEVEPNSRSLLSFIAQFEQDNDAKTQFKERLHQHYLQNLQEMFSPVGVARRIAEAYESLA